MKMKWKESEGLRRLDDFLALHQRLTGLVVAGMAVAGAGLIFRFCGSGPAPYAALALAFLLAAGYAWAGRAPYRALRRTMERARAEDERPGALDFVLRMEKNLPAMKQKEMAYVLTGNRAVLLHSLGRTDEALELLRNFDRCWDKTQREQLDALIRQMQEKNAPEREEEA